MKCENCEYYYAVGFAHKECQFVGDFAAPCDEPDPDPIHYTVGYNGYVFWNDNQVGVNFFDTDSWDEAISLYNRLHDDGVDVWIDDNWYNVTLRDGEWS